MDTGTERNPLTEPNYIRLRQILLEIIRFFDEDQAEREYKYSMLELIDLVQACDMPPHKTETLFHAATEAGEVFFQDSLHVNILVEGCESWFRSLVETRKLAVHLPQETPAHEITREPVSRAVVKPRPVAEPWDRLVLRVREELLGFPATGLGLLWSMPRKIWESPWVEAYRVAAFTDEDERQGVILIPTKKAADFPEALEWWKSKVKVAASLYEQAVPDSRIANVIEHADPLNPAYVLLDHNPPCASLIESTSFTQLGSLNAKVEAALAWCELLTGLGRRGVFVVDLPPALLSQRWSMSQKSVYLADPTAVIPSYKILPEYRTSGGLPKVDMYRNAACDQVFVVGALLLACIRGDLECLQTGISVCGPSASLSALAGLPQLSNRAPNEVSPSVCNLLERHEGSHGVDCTALTYALQWALTEDRSARYPTLQKLSADLQKCFK
jgi:hypothetical protein